MSEPSESVRFGVQGMTCGACVSRISRAIRRLDGVADVHVDLRSETVTVRHAPAVVSLATVAAAVTAAGYVPAIDAAVTVEAAPRTSLVTRLLAVLPRRSSTGRG